MEARLIFMAIVCLCIAQLAFASEPKYTFNNQRDEVRFEKLLKEIRCVVCQNQSLYDSNSAFATDLRTQIYNMMNAGKADRHIREFLRARYGDSIMFMPPWRAGTILLWLGPVFMLFIAFFSFRAITRLKRPQGQYAC